MEYELDYNFGTFVLTNWATKSETTISDTEALDWSGSRRNCRSTRRANDQIDSIFEAMQLQHSF